MAVIRRQRDPGGLQWISCALSLLADPLVLEYGKSLASLLPLALGCPGLIMLPSGSRIVILHQVHDRAMSDSLRHALSDAWVSSMSRHPLAPAEASNPPQEDPAPGSSSLFRRPPLQNKK